MQIFQNGHDDQEITVKITKARGGTYVKNFQQTYKLDSRGGERAQRAHFQKRYKNILNKT